MFHSFVCPLLPVGFICLLLGNVRMDGDLDGLSRSWYDGLCFLDFVISARLYLDDHDVTNFLDETILLWLLHSCIGFDGFRHKMGFFLHTFFVDVVDG
ncbi:hypothetical protein BJX96DRAFT_19527 [Aspergillus floccosus]